MKTVIFYHNADLDGKACGAILKRELKNDNIMLYGIDHGDEFPWELIDRDTTVYMCDFSLPNFRDMWKINDTCRNFIWIDHHKSAIEKYQKSRDNIFQDLRYAPHLDGYRNVGDAACKLTWVYFHPNEDVPKAIDLLSRYDVWDKSDKDFWEMQVLPFQYGMKSVNTDPESEVWDRVLTHSSINVSLNELISDGQIILWYINRENEYLADRDAFEVAFEGHPAIAINSSIHTSSVLESVYNENIHDLMIVFSISESTLYVSLYSTKSDIDCSELALKFGGGGHKGAAGFERAFLGMFPWSV